ncbi:hypothetical protein AB4383_17440 [Vibrio breoganii]|uniref:hypothetical protein n=1 Tax=Vibrio breoganii TaxID=553239 RepID=UPI0018E420D7|nr:hypothetical protein [Vibrio breoganii]
MYKKTAVALGLASILTGCVTPLPESVCTPDTRLDIETADVPVTPIEDRKVIVLPVEIEFDDVASQRISAAMRTNLETQVRKSGAKVIDRKVANKLKSEIQLAEQSGRYNTTGVPIADVAIMTEITASDFKSKFNEASEGTNILTGDPMIIPANCQYEMKLTAVAKVVSLPDMTLIKQVELTGDQKGRSDTRNSECRVTESIYNSYASKTALEAVNMNTDLRNLLAPTAPVLEIRQCTAGTMAKVGLGHKHQIQGEAAIKFSQLMKNDDGEVETFAVGEGTVLDISNGISSKYSWVSIDEETALKLKKGHAAKVHHTNSSFDVFSDHANSLLGIEL